jgi:hypothetical protein
MPSPWEKVFDQQPPARQPLTPEQRERAITNLNKMVETAINHLALFNEVQTMLKTTDQEFWCALAFAKGAARGAAVRTGTQATASESMWKFMEDLGYKSITEA